MLTEDQSRSFNDLGDQYDALWRDIIHQIRHGVERAAPHATWELVQIPARLLVHPPPKENVPSFRRDADAFSDTVLGLGRQLRDLHNLLERQARLQQEYDSDDLWGIVLRRLDAIERRISQ